MPEPGQMRTIRQVRKRDGRLVEFDESKIADAIYKAALSVGGEDRFLAEELASVVTLFLEKTYFLDKTHLVEREHGRTRPTIEEVQDMVEKVLIETGHAQTAKAYILYRERRAKMREAEEVPQPPAQGTLFEPGPPTVLDGLEGRARPLSEEAIARGLVAETELGVETAEEIARAVRERVEALDRDRVDAALVSRYVDAELLDRGLATAADRRGGVHLARRRVEQALFPKESERRGTPAGRLAGTVMRQYALEDIYDAEVSDAHLSGRIHLSGLETPSGVFAASFSPDTVRTHGIPGLGGKFRPDSVGTPRRFAAWLGRAVRSLAPHVTHGITISRLNLLLAPLVADLDDEELREEAWHLLTELAGIPGVEIELSLAPPPILAARKALGADGGVMEETYGKFRDVSVRFTAAFLEVRGTGAGLGERGELPRLALTLGPGAFEDRLVRDVLDRAVGEALAREPVLFVLDREDIPLLGTPWARVRLEDPSRLTDTSTLTVTVGARAVINLPRAALRAGSGNIGAFHAEVEAAAGLAIRGLKARERFLMRAAAGPDGPLAPFARGRGDRPPILDLAGATWSLGVTGLNEAVAYVTGHEIHETDEAVKIGQKALGTASLAGQAARSEGLTVEVDAAEDERCTAILFGKDRERYAEPVAAMPSRYTAGIAIREDAPVDLALRLETEGRLG
ncbi:MAG: anaerobic ribonucleoside-triphosphate reductase, partial [Planctomycetota bacterium]